MSMEVWMIYHHPDSGPDSYVARLWMFQSTLDKAPVMTKERHSGPSLEVVRALIHAHDGVCWLYPRSGTSQNTNLVESWRILRHPTGG